VLSSILSARVIQFGDDSQGFKSSCCGVSKSEERILPVVNLRLILGDLEKRKMFKADGAPLVPASTVE